jgi:site-specific DNA-methyltransferase (adenine-specific)
MAVLAGLPDAAVDAVIVDPPYGTTDLAWDTAPQLAPWWAQVHRVTKETGVIAVFTAQPFTSAVIGTNRKNYRYELIWSKTRPTGFLDANRRPLRSHENILIFARRMRGSTYHPQKTPGRPYHARRSGRRCAHYRQSKTVETVNRGDRHPWSVLTFPHDVGGMHPTQKPLALVEWLVRSYTDPGDVVLDCYMGSGTTGEACALNGRGFIGVERDAEYFRFARHRITAARLRSSLPRPPADAAVTAAGGDDAGRIRPTTAHATACLLTQ